MLVKKSTTDRVGRHRAAVGHINSSLSPMARPLLLASSRIELVYRHSCFQSYPKIKNNHSLIRWWTVRVNSFRRWAQTNNLCLLHNLKYSQISNKHLIWMQTMILIIPNSQSNLLGLICHQITEFIRGQMAVD